MRPCPIRYRAAALAAALLLAAIPQPAAASPSEGALPSPPGRAASHRPGPGRLPDELAPTRYDLKLKIDPRQPRFQGELTIDLEVASPTYTVNFHARDLTIREITASAGGRTLTGHVTDAVGAGAEPGQGEKITTFPGTLPPGPASLHFTFDGPYNENLAGLYRARDEGDRWYAYTQFETADARRAFPCFDEPRFKTPFRVELTIPDGMTAVANTAEASRESRDGWTRVVFRETKPLPTYLVAFVVGDLDVVEGPRTTAPLHGVAAKGKGVMLGEALKDHAEMLPIMEAYFGRPYPFDKLDAAAQVEFAAGAMENAGLITYREETLLIDPAGSSLSRKRRIASIIAHEMAHEWFGDLVTMPWWNDIWLNESFATWMAARTVDSWHPDEERGDAILTGRERAFAADALAGARAVRQKVNGLTDAESAFDSLTYQKGASIISMIEHWLGEEAFRNGIRRYLDAHAYGNATAEDLLSALKEASGKDVSRMALSFLDRPGIPLITVDLACPPGAPPSAVLTQARYRPLGSASPEATAGGDLWIVPVCLAYPSSDGVANTCLVLSEEKTTAALPGATSCPEWIHPDAGEYGYYRWSIPSRMAARLGSAVKRSWIPAKDQGSKDPAVRSRLALLDQAWATVAAGMTGPDAFITLLEEIAHGADRREIDQVVIGIERLAETWDDLAHQESFRTLARRVLGPAGKRLGWDPPAGESADDSLMRSRVLSALGRYGGASWVLDGAASRAAGYLKNRSSVSPDLAPVALTLSAMGGRLGVREIKGLLTGARTPSERTNALAALASLPQGPALSQALDLSLTSAVRVQDSMAVIRGALQIPASRAQALDFLERHYDEVVKRMPGGFASAARLPRTIGSLCSAEERDAARAFFEGKKLEGSARQLDLGVDEANQCIALRAFGREALAAYLSRPQPAAE